VTSPWDDRQKPNERSKDHDKRDHGHGPHEHGLGGQKDDRPDAKKPKGKGDVETFLAELAAGPDLMAAAALPDQLASTAAFPSSYYVPNPPPVRDQGLSPQCVAYSDGYDQAHMDRPEAGRWLDFDESRFFSQIGGGPNGAYLGDALVQRRDFGYPTVAGGDRGAHRIAAFYRIATAINSIKAAIVASPLNGGVLAIGPWYHSWFHPLASGKLPAPDYAVGGHATWWRGWNDNLGFRIRNSWGTDWGLAGDCFLPYAHVARMWEIWRTKDR